MRIFFAMLLGLGLQDDVTKGWKSPWAGATVGSRLKWKVTSEAVGQKATSERIETVKQVEADEVTVEEKQGEESNDEQHSVTLPTELEGPWKKTGDEEIKVGDRTFKCAVYESKKEELGVSTTRVWTSADAPHWAVKATFTFVQGGQETAAWTEELVRLSEGVTVAGKEIKCRVVRKSMRAGGGIEYVHTTWWTDELPGRAARRIFESRLAGMKVETRTSELVEVQKR